MTEMTMDEALAHVALAETMTWLQEAGATVRFYDADDGPRVWIAVHTDESDPEVITVAKIPLADSSPESLAISLSAAREEVEPLIQRRKLRAV